VHLLTYFTVRINTPPHRAITNDREFAALGTVTLIQPFDYFYFSRHPSALTVMPSTANSVDNVPSHGRRQSALGPNEITLTRTQTRHGFQARGPAKHITRLRSAQEEGHFGVALSVRHSDYTTQGMSVADFDCHKDALPWPCRN
jgi:hypothetical protein